MNKLIYLPSKTMHVLIIEDHVITLSYLQNGLKEYLITSDIAQDGQEGLYLP